MNAEKDSGHGGQRLNHIARVVTNQGNATNTDGISSPAIANGFL